jgi:hypothetical protein
MAKVVEQIILPAISMVRTIIPEEKIVLPFPGKGAKFVYASGNFEVFDSGAPLNRIIEFRSKTPGSLFTEFSVLGYRDGEINISVGFNKKINEKAVKNYLATYDIVPNAVELMTTYHTSGRTQLRNMFNILTENNEIPESHFEQICNIIDKA